MCRRGGGRPKWKVKLRTAMVARRRRSPNAPYIPRAPTRRSPFSDNIGAESRRQRNDAAATEDACISVALCVFACWFRSDRRDTCSSHASCPTSRPEMRICASSSPAGSTPISCLTGGIVDQLQCQWSRALPACAASWSACAVVFKRKAESAVCYSSVDYCSKSLRALSAHGHYQMTARVGGMAKICTYPGSEQETSMVRAPDQDPELS
jgi:hypothetical protein